MVSWAGSLPSINWPCSLIHRQSIRALLDELRTRLWESRPVATLRFYLSTETGLLPVGPTWNCAPCNSTPVTSNPPTPVTLLSPPSGTRTPPPPPQDHLTGRQLPYRSWNHSLRLQPQPACSYFQEQWLKAINNPVWTRSLSGITHPIRHNPNQTNSCCFSPY